MKFSKLAASVFVLSIASLPAQAETDTAPLKKVEWSFNGPRGTFAKDAAQRGYQVYKEVCAACHGLYNVRYGNLAGKGKSIDEIRSSNLGLTNDEVKALAAEYKARDTDDDGQPIERKATPTDYFARPYKNEKEARAANNGAYPPDLSTVVKARVGGADYIYSLLTGYDKPPQDIQVGEGRYYNPYYPGGQISMAAPLHTEGQVTYADGTKATVEQMAKDVTTFLAWASEPETEERRQMGAKVMFYLAFMTLILYLAKRKIWADVK